MQAGRLDRRILLEEPQQMGTTDSGQPIVKWLPVGTVWARREPLKGQERFLADQVAAHVDTRFTIRYRSGVTPEKRIRDLSDPIVQEEGVGRVYDITQVLELGRREGLQVFAEARAEASVA